MTVIIPIPGRWFTTPKGLAYCDLVTDRGPHGDLEWICTVFPTGQIWSFTNLDVRAAKNTTLGLINPEDLRAKYPVQEPFSDWIGPHRNDCLCPSCSEPLAEPTGVPGPGDA